jgi:ESS family glutamate:Na+ symporter
MTLDPLSSLLAAVVVLLIGTLINRRVAFLSMYNIPDPITGGLLFAAVASVVWLVASFKVGIDQTIKPVLLLMFFAGVGLCADLRTLSRGARRSPFSCWFFSRTSCCRTLSASRWQRRSTCTRSSAWWRVR